MTFDPRHSVDDAFQLLSARLDPIIEVRLGPSLGGLPWPTVLAELDKMRGKVPKHYDSKDLQSQLKVLTERLGNLGYPFDDHTRVVSTLGNELRIMRNRWAHLGELSSLDAWRTHDFAVRLLDRFDDSEGVSGAQRMRDEAFAALVAERGEPAARTTAPLTPLPPQAIPAEPAPPTANDVVSPDAGALERSDAASTPTIGSERSVFEAWTVVPVGDVSVLDDLPKKLAKEQVRAVAAEIVEFEGPIHIDRLAQLTAASFGVQRLWPGRSKKLVYQIRQTGLIIDDERFVWPPNVVRESWTEFRPNDSTVVRPFEQISLVEIANALRQLRRGMPAAEETELYAATLRTFGRRRRTKQISARLFQAHRVANAR